MNWSGNYKPNHKDHKAMKSWELLIIIIMKYHEANNDKKWQTYLLQKPCHPSKSTSKSTQAALQFDGHCRQSPARGAVRSQQSQRSQRSQLLWAWKLWEKSGREGHRQSSVRARNQETGRYDQEAISIVALRCSLDLTAVLRFLRHRAHISLVSRDEAS